MVRTARPRLVRVPCTYSAWHLRVSCPAPLARRWPLSLPWPLSPLATARRRLVRYVQYGGPGTYVSAQTTTRAPSRGSSPLPERSTRFNTPPSPVRSISGGSAAHVTMPALNDVQARLRHDETRGCGASPTAAKTSDASMVSNRQAVLVRRKVSLPGERVPSLRRWCTRQRVVSLPMMPTARAGCLGSRSATTFQAHAAGACTPPSTTKFRATMLCHARTLGRL